MISGMFDKVVLNIYNINRKALERSSGYNLTKFFDQWLYGKGYPQIKLEYIVDANDQTAQFIATQKQEDKKNEILLFDVSMKVAVTYNDGTTSSVRLEFTGNRAVAFTRVPQGTTVRSINVDPDCELLFSLEFDPGEDILKTLLETGWIHVNLDTT